MSLNPDIRDQAYQFFIEEAQELLQVLETGLLDLRQDCSTPKVHELMRAAHSIKGGAASVDLSAIGLLAHRLEDFFKALYSDDVNFDAELESLLLQGYDCLSHPLLEQINAGNFDEEAALLNAEPVFAALEERLAEALKNADSYIPSSNDLGVDIVASIFEVDVVQELDRLQEVVQNPQNYHLPTELEKTLEMFAGFAELFNLSGFTEIVQTAQIALQSQPQKALAIIEATVADCTEAAKQVVAGDRERGGSISLTLRDLARANATARDDTRPPDIALSDSNPADLDLAEIWSSAPMAEAEELFAATMPEDNLWADFAEEPEPLEPSTVESQPAAEDDNGLFELVDNATESDNSLWSEFSVTESPAEDIFGHFVEEPEPLEPSAVESQPAVADISQLFDLVEDAPETAEVLSFTEIPDDSDNLWSNLPETELPDDFGNTAKEETSSELEPQLTVPDNDNEDAPTAIVATADSLSAVFESLPPAEPKLFAPPAKSKPQVPTESSQTIERHQPPKTKLSVRVDLERLERLNNLVGELTINRSSLGLQNEQLQENVGELEQKFWRFREVTKQLQSISDRLLLEARARYPLLPTEPAIGNDDAEFDALEMDSYSQLYSSLQVVLEEMVQLEESVEDITIFAQQSNRTINGQRQMLGQMRDELMWVRMLPLERILQRFPRTLRDLSRKYHKSVDLKLEGTGVLVDRAVLEKLSDPLLHLLRNGFDHGIEAPEVRIQRGKPATGSIEIRAYYQGNQTIIEVKDDGQGLDLERITQKGVERGLISAGEAAAATPERLFELIFEPGFSTATKVSEISGRGVGMNIVRSQVETLKGKISVTSSPGLGSTFTLRLPVTLTIAKLLVCSLGATAFAIPSDSIEEIIIPEAGQIKFANEQKFLSLNDRLIPVYVLQETLGYNCPIPDTDANSKVFKTISPPEDWLAPLLLLKRGQQMHALEVVSLLSEQELVI
ncbi:MAG: chemotaxis protein CheA, partial [Cyanobacteria bacterium J06623_7]